MQDPPTSTDAFMARRSLGFLLRRSHQLLSQRAERLFEGVDLTLSQWIALKLIDEGLAATASEVARMLDHNSGATTRLIDQLEARGLVLRRRETGDRRVITLTVTDQGRAAVSARQHLISNLHGGMLANFSADEAEMLVTLLLRLVSYLEGGDIR